MISLEKKNWSINFEKKIQIGCLNYNLSNDSLNHKKKTDELIVKFLLKESN